MSLKKLFLMIFKILRLFVKPFTADDSYSLPNIDNLAQPIQTQLSQKQKNISEFFSSVLKFALEFEHFQKKDDPHS